MHQCCHVAKLSCHHVVRFQFPAGLQQQAAALQAAAALNTGNNSLLGPAGNLDLLARTTGDLTARDLALSNLASLGGNLVSQSSLNSSLSAASAASGLNNPGI